MNTSDLLALADREAETLKRESQTAPAAIVSALAERVRCLSERLREAGLSEKPAKVI